MTDEQQNNQEPSQKPDDIRSTKSTGEPKSEQKPDDGTSTTPTGKQEPGKKADDGTSKTFTAYQKKRSKTDEKGFGEGKYSSEGSFRNPFGKKEDKNKYSSQSSTKEKSKYSDLSTELLETWRTRFQTEIESLNKQYENLTEKIEDLVEEKGEVYPLITEERRIQKKLDRFSQEREEIRRKLEKLEKDLEALDKELRARESKKERYGETRDGASPSDSSEEAENVTAQSLFADDEPIQNTILYVATFFPGLNPQDFKRVVSLLLEGRAKTILVKESITTKEGKTQVKETQKKKLLNEIWQESFDRPDKYLRNCYLKVSRQNGKQGIDFTLPHLRKDFINYLEEKESLYLGEQLQRTQNLGLLLDTSDDIAERAMEVAAKAAIDYPNYYAEDWLIELLVKIAKEDEQRVDLLLGRLSKLIYRLQIEPDYSKSEDIAQSFLEHLISPEYRSLAFAIVQDLMDKHLRSGALGIQSAKQILTWLRKLLDREGLEEKDKKLQADVYSLLVDLLWQSGFFLYIYEFLEILKEWLPDRDLPPEEYIPSNIAVLLLLFTYCEETTWNLPLKFYGEWPSAYPLFAPLHNDNDDEENSEFNECTPIHGQGTDEFSHELETLCSWLFYSDVKGKLAVDNVFKDLNLGNINLLEKISFCIAEWFVILLGFDDKNSTPEVLKLVNNLIRHIISNSSRIQQRQLSDFWTYFRGEYLDLATTYNELGNRKLKKQFFTRRNLLRRFKQRFKSLQKEMETAK